MKEEKINVIFVQKITNAQIKPQNLFHVKKDLVDITEKGLDVMAKILKNYFDRIILSFYIYLK